MKYIYINLLLLFNLSIGYSQIDSYILDGNNLNNVKVSGVLLSDLMTPDESFSILSNLGDLLDSSYSKTVVEERWNFSYEGIELIYTNFNGEIELESFVINNCNVSVDTGSGIEVKVNTSLETIKAFSMRGDKSYRIFDKAVSQPSEKFNSTYRFLEFEMDNQAEKVAEIRYKAKIL